MTRAPSAADPYNAHAPSASVKFNLAAAPGRTPIDAPLPNRPS